MAEAVPIDVGADQRPLAEVVESMLEDDASFSIRTIDYVRAGTSGMSWTETLRGILTVEEWDEVMAQTSPRVARILAIVGSFHMPGATWELPFRIRDGVVEVPDDAPQDRRAVLRQRLVQLFAA